jgi:hypothetical protein
MRDSSVTIAHLPHSRRKRESTISTLSTGDFGLLPEWHHFGFWIGRVAFLTPLCMRERPGRCDYMNYIIYMLDCFRRGTMHGTPDFELRKERFA